MAILYADRQIFAELKKISNFRQDQSVKLAKRATKNAK